MDGEVKHTALLLLTLAKNCEFWPETMFYHPQRFYPRHIITMIAKYFKNSSIGLCTRALSAEVGGKIDQKVTVSSVQREKSFSLPTKVNLCIRCKILCKLFFAIKHYLTIWSDKVVGVQNWCPKRRKYAVSYLKAPRVRSVQCPVKALRSLIFFFFIVAGVARKPHLRREFVGMVASHGTTQSLQPMYM